MPVEMYPLPGPKRPIRIRYVVMSIPILELSAMLCTVQASYFSVLFKSEGTQHVDDPLKLPKFFKQNAVLFHIVNSNWTMKT